jgi:tetratricopeptide (TPR) repeat protein
MKMPFLLAVFACLLPMLLDAQMQQQDSMSFVHKVDSLLATARQMANNGNVKEAFSLMEKTESEVKSVLGDQNAVYANCIFAHADMLYGFNYYKDAIEYFNLSNKLIDSLFGKNDIKYIKGLTSLGWMYASWGQTEKSIGFLAEAKQICENTSNVNSAEYAAVMHSLGLAYHIASKYEQAESFYIQANDLRRKLPGEQTRAYASSLMSLGLLYRDLARFDKAETDMLQALAIEENISQGKSMNYARYLNNIGSFYWNVGQLDKAESFHMKARAVKERLLGKNHSSYAMSLHNLALVKEDLGQKDKAIALYLECNSIRENTTGKETTDYALTMNNLGSIFQELGDYKKSEAYHLGAKAIREKIFGKDHAQYVMSLTNLANLYRSMGRIDESMALEKECIEIRGRIEGKDHPNYAYSLGGLAENHFRLGEYDKSEALYIEALELRKRTFGSFHPEYLKTLGNLGRNYWVLGRHRDAAVLLSESISAHRVNLDKGIRFLQEKELNSLIQSTKQVNDLYFSLGMESKEQAADFSSKAWNEGLFSKGIIQESILATNKQMEAAPDTIREVYYIWKSYLTRIATALSAPLAERTDISRLEEQADSIEKQLIRSVAGYGEAFRQITWQEVQAALRPGEAAVEFIRFQYQNPWPTDSTLYAALLLKPGIESPVFIPLFEEKQLRALLDPLADRGSSGFDDIYGGKTGQALYQLLWVPLLPHLADVKAVCFSPAGLLHRLNLNAIPTEKPGESIGQRFDLSMMGSTRQILNASIFHAGFDRTSTAVVFGGIDYNVAGTVKTPDAAPVNTQERNRGLSFFQTDSTLRGNSWEYLKYSEKEADNIRNLLQKSGLQVVLHKGQDASEEAFKALGRGEASPNIIHISTHGFFFPDPASATQTNFGNMEPVFKTSDHPMIRSGLILAGGNQAWKTGQPPANREDGILTAYEISQMDLSHTDLVVLSACETGLGEIEGNEGVYGLQRAFKIAGAKNLVMSLWQVPDYQTQELMTTLYRNMLEGKMPARQALLAAQDDMRRKRYEPYYWAGFVLVE